MSHLIAIRILVTISEMGIINLALFNTTRELIALRLYVLLRNVLYYDRTIINDQLQPMPRSFEEHSIHDGLFH